MSPSPRLHVSGGKKDRTGPARATQLSLGPVQPPQAALEKLADANGSLLCSSSTATPYVLERLAVKRAARSADESRYKQPAQPSFRPTPLDDGLPARPAPAGGDPASKAAIDIAAKRAEIQAKLAAMKAAAGGGAPGIAPAPVAPVPTRAPPPTSSLPPRPNVPAAPAAPASSLDPELARKIAEAKRKVAEMAARKQAAETKVNPYLVCPPRRKVSSRERELMPII